MRRISVVLALFAIAVLIFQIINPPAAFAVGEKVIPCGERTEIGEVTAVDRSAGGIRYFVQFVDEGLWMNGASILSAEKPTARPHPHPNE